MRLVKIEKDILCNKPYLDKDDNCFYYITYDSRSELSENKNKQLIINLKISIQDLEKNSDRKPYKDQAIREIAGWLKATFVRYPKLQNCLWVLAPSSKRKDDPNYDDRLHKVFKIIKNEFNVNFTDDVAVKKSTYASHKTGNRDPCQKLKNYECTKSFRELVSRNNKIFIFDDIITTGATFRATKNFVLKINPEANVYGLFIGNSV